MSSPHAIVKKVTRAKLRGYTTSITLSGDYDGQHALVEVPVERPQCADGSEAEVYRRGLFKLVEALDHLLTSPSSVAWPR